jgi:hypothetical protein
MVYLMRIMMIWSKHKKIQRPLLFKYLDRSPAKLLEVGVGLGKTHQKLIDKG